MISIKHASACKLLGRSPNAARRRLKHKSTGQHPGLPMPKPRNWKEIYINNAIELASDKAAPAPAPASPLFFFPHPKIYVVYYNSYAVFIVKRLTKLSHAFSQHIVRRHVRYSFSDIHDFIKRFLGLASTGAL